jgi:hypothetical protein
VKAYSPSSSGSAGSGVHRRLSAVSSISEVMSSPSSSISALSSRLCGSTRKSRVSDSAASVVTEPPSSTPLIDRVTRFDCHNQATPTISSTAKDAARSRLTLSTSTRGVNRGLGRRVAERSLTL